MHFPGAPRRLRSRSESAAGRDGAGAFKKSNLCTSSHLLRPAPPHWARMVATIRRKSFAAIRRRVRAHVIDQKGCDLGCGSIGVKQQCCGKRVCETCALNLVRVRSPVGLATTCQIACPFCRHVRSLTHERVKALMRLRCPSHAKPVEVVGSLGEAGSGVLVHEPCEEHGCYACRGSVVLACQPHLCAEMVRTTVDVMEQEQAAREVQRRLEEIYQAERSRVHQLESMVISLRFQVQAADRILDREREVLHRIAANTTCARTFRIVTEVLGGSDA